jgi:hypothetical protein
VPGAHACNANYLGGRDQEDYISKLTQTNSALRPYLEKPFTKIGLVEWLEVQDLSSSPSTKKKKNQNLIQIPYILVDSFVTLIKVITLYLINPCFLCWIFSR